jgi:hypothetical protein
VVIDYIQEVYAQGRFDSRTLEIQHITRIMKDIAKQLNVLVIVPSQVTINGMNRSGWQLVPKYKDAQWAQAIKNVAHCMTSVFRPNMIQGLVTRDHEGYLAVKGLKDGETHDYQSVFVKLVKTRRGQLSHNYLHMVHNGDMGLEVVKSKIWFFSGGLIYSHTVTFNTNTRKMATIINASIDVTKIPKESLIKGKKGTYANVTVFINDETRFGNNASIAMSMSKEEREAGQEKVWLGNGRVVFTEGEVTLADREESAPSKVTEEALPFWTQGDEIARLIYERFT